jgi:hypothetical protein
MMWLPYGRRSVQVVSKLLINKHVPSTRMAGLSKPTFFSMSFEFIRLRRSCEAQLYDTVKRSACVTLTFQLFVIEFQA